jgi:hypothetical protein
MSSNYPASIDPALGAIVGNTIQPADVNDLYNVVRAIETEVGFTGAQKFVIKTGQAGMTGSFTGATLIAATTISGTSVKNASGTLTQYTDAMAKGVISGTGLIDVTNGLVTTTATAYTDTNARAVVSGAGNINVTDAYVTMSATPSFTSVDASTISGATIIGGSVQALTSMMSPSIPVASGNAPGTPGQIVMGTDGYFYGCSGVDMWGRIQLTETSW